MLCHDVCVMLLCDDAVSQVLCSAPSTAHCETHGAECCAV